MQRGKNSGDVLETPLLRPCKATRPAKGDGTSKEVLAQAKDGRARYMISVQNTNSIESAISKLVLLKSIFRNDSLQVSISSRISV